MKTRSWYEVTAAILKAVVRGETCNKIKYMAMLGSAQFKLYLDLLIKSGLVHEVNDGAKMVYKVTPKGKEQDRNCHEQDRTRTW